MPRASAFGRKVRTAPADRIPEEAGAEALRGAPREEAAPEAPAAPGSVAREIQVTIVLPPSGPPAAEGAPGEPAPAAPPASPASSIPAFPPRPGELDSARLPEGFGDETRTSSAPEIRAIQLPDVPAPGPAASSAPPAAPAAGGAAAAAAAGVDLSTIESVLEGVRRGLGELRGHLEAPRGAEIGEAIASLGRQVKGISDHVIEVRHMATARARKQETGEVAFNKLYEEMTRYRDNFLFTAEKPLFMALILLYDTVCRIERKLEGQPAADDIRNIKEELIETLYRHDIERIEARPERMDAAFQKAVRREETGNLEEDMRVTEVVRDGFRWGEKVIRPQEVVVKRYFAP